MRSQVGRDNPPSPANRQVYHRIATALRVAGAQSQARLIEEGLSKMDGSAPNALLPSPTETDRPVCLGTAGDNRISGSFCLRGLREPMKSDTRASESGRSASDAECAIVFGAAFLQGAEIDLSLPPTIPGAEQRVSELDRSSSEQVDRSGRRHGMEQLASLARRAALPISISNQAFRVQLA